MKKRLYFTVIEVNQSILCWDFSPYIQNYMINVIYYKSNNMINKYIYTLLMNYCTQ
jgi:hypothetical protein